MSKEEIDLYSKPDFLIRVFPSKVLDLPRNFKINLSKSSSSPVLLAFSGHVDKALKNGLE